MTSISSSFGCSASTGVVVSRPNVNLSHLNNNNNNEDNGAAFTTTTTSCWPSRSRSPSIEILSDEESDVGSFNLFSQHL